MLFSKNNTFEYPEYVLDASEYAKIISEINTNYSLYINKEYCAHTSVGVDGYYYIYLFENHGYADYNIYARYEF